MTSQPSLRNPSLDFYDVIVLGAGAAGLICASVAGQRGRSVLLLEQSELFGLMLHTRDLLSDQCQQTRTHAPAWSPIQAADQGLDIAKRQPQ